MASHTISGQAWPDGTVVGVYPATAVPASSDVPSGTPITTGTVSGGSVMFTGLAENVRYYAYAGGVGRGFLVRAAVRTADRQRIEALEASLGTIGVTAGPVAAADTGGLAPASADAFLDSIGVNVHLFFTSSKVNAYEDHTAVRAALSALKFRHARDTYFNSATQRARIRAIWEDLAIRWQLIFDSRIDSHVTTGNGHGANALDILTANNVVECSAIEGSNEFDTQSSQGVDAAARMTAARTEQIQLWTAYDARTILTGIPLVMPSVADPQNAGLMGDLSPYTTHGNLHSYPGGETPRANNKGSNQSLKGWIANVRVAGAGRPVIASETGYHTNIPQTTGHQAASEAVAGIYDLQLPFEYWRQGVARTFFYELFDQLAGLGALSGTMTAGQTTLPLIAYPLDWPTSGTVDVRIDNEVVRITAGWSTTSPTITRNVTGSIGGAVSHAAFTQVSLVTSSANGSNQENRFGLYRYDRSPKPSATYLQRLMSLLADKGKAPLTPLGFNLEAGTDTVRWVLLQKTTGDWWLAVWNDLSIWNTAAGVPVVAANQAVTLKLRSSRDVAVYAPTVSDVPQSFVTGTTSVALTLKAAEVQLVKISGGAGS